MVKFFDSNKSDENDNQKVVITGGDDQYIADVILDSDGNKKLWTKSDVALSSDLQIQQEYDQNETMSDVTYTDIYINTGVVTISGFTLQFSDKKVWVRLEVDGVEIFDINCEKLKEISDWNSFPQPQTYISWNDNLKVFYFTPNFPIKTNTSVKIQARSKTGQSKDYLGSVIQVG